MNLRLSLLAALYLAAGLLLCQGQAAGTASLDAARDAGTAHARSDLPLASIESHFSSDTNASVYILQALRAATGTIHVAMFSFTSKPLAAELTNAAARRVDVRVVADRSQAAGGGSCVPWLLQVLGTNHVQLSGGRTKVGIMHHKFCIIDGASEWSGVVIAGSYNWTGRAEHDNWEDFALLRGNGIAARWEVEFGKLQQQKGSK
jgi:phosphatidylserine/phosphatidylglycerophosphate/cardiolipin synthase-like enzyme